jgi:hypothetical protein
MSGNREIHVPVDDNVDAMGGGSLYETTNEYEEHLTKYCYCMMCTQKIFLRKCLWQIKSAKYYKSR